MAEVGIIASALQIADIGVRLSLRLYTFGETVASADKAITSISENVSLTSTVLKELGQTLAKDQTFRICSPNAVKTADSIVAECQKIFQEMDHVLVKKFAHTKSTEKDNRRIKAAQTLERLRWPFIKGKIDLLMSNLEKQKSTLVLMLNVIVLAKQEHERIEPFTIIADQRSLIEDLARSNEGYVRKFEQLRLSCEDTPIHPGGNLAVCNKAIPRPPVPIAQELASASAMDAASQGEPSTGAPGPSLGPYKDSNPSTTSSPARLGWLLQQYSNLMSTLLREANALDYEITEESRSRIRANIVLTHKCEMKMLEQVYYSKVPSLAHPKLMHMSRSGTSHSATRGYSRSKLDTTWSNSQVTSNFASPSSNCANETYTAAQSSIPDNDELLRRARRRPASRQSLDNSANTCRIRRKGLVEKDHIAGNWHSAQTDTFAKGSSKVHEESEIEFECSYSPAANRENDQRISSSTPTYTLGIVPQSPMVQSQHWQPLQSIPPSQPQQETYTTPWQTLNLAPGLYFEDENESSQSDTLQPSQLGPAGAATSWQQRSGGDRPYHYHREGGVVPPLSSHSALSGDHVDGYNGFTGGREVRDSGGQLISRTLDSIPTSNMSYIEESSSQQMRKRKVESASPHPAHPLGGMILDSENDSSNSRPSKHPRTPSSAIAYAESATVTKDKVAFKGGANDGIDVPRFRLPCGNDRALKNGIGFSRVSCSQALRRERSPKHVFEHNGIEAGAEDVVNKLLAIWTTLPIPANRMTPRPDSITVAAY